jgi:hypothetical protein
MLSLSDAELDVILNLAPPARARATRTILARVRPPDGRARPNPPAAPMRNPRIIAGMVIKVQLKCKRELGA